MGAAAAGFWGLCVEGAHLYAASGSIADQFAAIGSIALVGLVCAVISLGGMARWRRGM